MSEISPESPQKFRHADPEKVRLVWDVLEGLKANKQVVTSDKLIRSLRKKINSKDDNIHLLLNEIEGDGLMDKSSTTSTSAKVSLEGYRLPDFKSPFPRQDHDWYCFKCHSAGVVFSCSDCFRVFHQDCVNELVRKSSPIRSPILHDIKTNFLCPVCKSRPKCEFSRKQIRKLLDFATHNLRKQALWKTFTNIGYKNIVKNEYLVYKYIDLEILNQKIKDGRYTALENFAVDVELLVHNVCILHGSFSHEADEARFFLRSVKMEIIEIELCTDCYINAKAKPSEWISKPCKPCHEIIWASNRTPRGAGMFSDAVISEYFWPAKILLEKDDGYEIRFFGGTHERMFVKRENTKPFKLAPTSVNVLRKSSNHGSQCGSGGFEKAWSEIQKLQNNIDSGYYTHSSGESDLPPSDDDYSDEMYVGPKRGKILAKFKDSSHLTSESPRSSINSMMNSKLSDRKRHESSTSNQASSITSSINPSISPNQNASRPRGRPSNVSKKQNIVPEPGSAAAHALSVLAETKAALSSGSSLGLTKFLESTASLKKPVVSNGKRKQLSSLSPKKGRPSRPEKRYKNDPIVSNSSNSSSSSSSSSSSRDSSKSSSAGDSKFVKKKTTPSLPRPRGRPPSNGLRQKPNEKVNKSLEKSFTSSSSKSKVSMGKKKQIVAKEKSSPKDKSRTPSFNKMVSSSDDSQSEDELTDRCVSEDHQSSQSKSDDDSDESSDSSSDSSFLLKGLDKNAKKKNKNETKKSRLENSKNKSRKSSSDITLKRPPFAPMFKGEQSSSSKVFANTSYLNSHGNSSINQRSSSNNPSSTPRSSQPSSVMRNGSGSSSNNTSFISGQNQATNQNSMLPGKQIFSSTPLSTIPRSHLPPNKRAAAEAAAMAMQSAGLINSQTSHNLNSAQNSSQLSGLESNQNMDVPHKVTTQKSFSVQTLHKTTQTLDQSACTACKEKEKGIIALEAKYKQQIIDIQDCLTKKFIEEKQSAINAAVDEIKAEFAKRIERETALNQKALEDAESKMTEAIIQTKRRQWCRNCLKEAIYHCCWNTSYCSIPCQQDHWQKEHKRQCRRKR